MIESVEFIAHKLLGLICHQDPFIVLVVQGHPLPLCPRCTGMHTGFFIFILSMCLISDEFRLKLARINPFVVLLLISVTGIEWILANYHLFSSSTVSRLLTGFCTGTGIGLLLIIYQARQSIYFMTTLTRRIVILSGICLLFILFMLVDPIQYFWLNLTLLLSNIVFINFLIVVTTLILRAQGMIRNLTYTLQ